MAAVAAVPAASERVFYPVNGQTPSLMEALREIFDRILTPLYGSQEKALGQIALSKDRLCYLLYEGERPVGVIAFKTVLSDEFQEFGVQKSLEIKSLFVVESTQNSGKGLGSALLQKFVDEADRLHLGHDAIHVTVSDTKRESLIFFLKKGFAIRHSWVGKYTKDGIEHLLARAVRIDAVARPQLAPQGRENKEPLEGDQKPIPQVLWSIPNAHWDDIHTLTLLPNQTLVSGSKDNTLCIWDLDGQLVRIVRDVEPTYTDEKRWITASTVINHEYWVSGDRNGEASLWRTNGDFVKNLPLRLPQGGHVSHPHNQRRINCLAPGADLSNPTLFVGLPTQFDEFNFIASKTIASVSVHKNDWVYCLQPLRDHRMAVVVAGNLAVWQKNGPRWKQTQTVIAEAPAPRSREAKNRRHISCMSPLLPDPGLFVVGAFDGSIKSADLERGAVVRTWTEHQGKVWAIETLARDRFASGGEDRSVRLWDARQPRSTHTLRLEGGGVSALRKLNENSFVVGESPPEQLKGAKLSRYDIRV